MVKNVDFSKFDIIWIEICNYPIGSIIQSHSHDFFHFIYVDSGEGIITVENEKYRMLPGLLFPIPKGAEHTFYNSSDEPLRTLELKFSLSSLDSERKMSDLPICMEVEESHVRNGLLSLYRETHTEQLMSRDIVSLHFQLLMTYILRCSENIREVSELKLKKNGISPEIESVMNHIRDNLTDDLSLDKLAKIAGFEKNYFLRKFKKQIGCTPVSYILGQRLEKAKELLRFSDMNITQISVATGFKSVHYFSKVFYDNVNIRPSDWREKLQ